MTMSIADARKLLEARKARGAPAWMVENAERELAEALAAAQQPQAEQQQQSSQDEDTTQGHYSVEEGVAKLLPWVVGLPTAVAVGLVMGRAVHSRQGRYIGRSLIRGLVYRSVGALTR